MPILLATIVEKIEAKEYGKVSSQTMIILKKTINVIAIKIGKQREGHNQDLSNGFNICYKLHPSG